MVWPFTSTARPKLSATELLLTEQVVVLKQQIKLLDQHLQVSHATRRASEAALQQLVRLNRRLWRLGVQPAKFTISSRSESMGFMNKVLSLPPISDADVVRQVVKLESPGKLPVELSYDATVGQVVEFSAPEGDEVTISLQYFDNADNPSTITSRTFIIVDDVPPEGPAALSDIASVSETTEPLFVVLEAEPAPEIAPVPEPTPEPIPEPTPLEPAVEPAPESEPAPETEE